MPLYEVPIPIVEIGAHTEAIRCAVVDSQAKWLITGSTDKTIRVWDVQTGNMQQVIHLPAGPAFVGQVFSLAISPDGHVIAAGGWTGGSTSTELGSTQQVYFFQREKGRMVSRIEELPDVATSLAFSHDGRWLATGLHHGAGLRIYDAGREWCEVARDEQYRSGIYGLSFASDGRLATTCEDGIRLYRIDEGGGLDLYEFRQSRRNSQPFDCAFNPTGTVLAVGHYRGSFVELLDGATLRLAARPQVLPPSPIRTNLDGSKINDGISRNLATVAWSADGETLFAAGRYVTNDGSRLIAWDRRGYGDPWLIKSGNNTVTRVFPLATSNLIVVGMDRWLALLSRDGTPVWLHNSQNIDLRDQRATFAVSSDGLTVDFNFANDIKSRSRFDFDAREISLVDSDDNRTAAAVQHGLPIDGWVNGSRPTLNGHRLPMGRGEICRSLAIHPNKKRFVIGTTWCVRAFDYHGEMLWESAAAGDLLATNIAADANIVLTASQDGIIRWHRLDDGVELVAVYFFSDRKNWVAWTPDGFYDSSQDAGKVLRWRQNEGWSKSTISHSIYDKAGSFRPDIFPLILRELDPVRVIGIAGLEQHRQRVSLFTGGNVIPGGRLHVLAVGISSYDTELEIGELLYAHRDALDFASLLEKSQSSIYQVKTTVLVNCEATRASFLTALRSVRESLEGGSRRDLVTIFFAGHGSRVHDRMYLQFSDADGRTPARVEETGLAVSLLQAEILEMAKSCRMLLLLDACHSGSAVGDGPQPINMAALRLAFAKRNVTILTSSDDDQRSFERGDIQHGVFTKALLDAFPAADSNNDRLLTPTELYSFVAEHVRARTDGSQTPMAEIRDNFALFASGK